MKKLLETVPKRVDAAFARHSLTLEKWVNLLRWFFCAFFALLSLWLFARDESGGAFTVLAFAALWLSEALFIGYRRRRAVADAQAAPLGTLAVWLDVAVISIGLLLCLAQGVLASAGFVLFLCYFPVLALSARCYRFVLPLAAAAVVSVFYLVLVLSRGGSLTPQVAVIPAIVWATAAAALILTLRPKKELARVAEETAEEAYKLGAKDKELELTELIHAQLMPVAQLEVPGLYCSSKHYAGLRTSGDYYQVFETARGPLVVVGDLSGAGLTATMNFARLHQQVSQVAERADSLTDVAEALNDFVRRQFPGHTFTCVLARWEGANLHYLNAGHLPAVRISKRVPMQLSVNSMALGVTDNPTFVEEVIEFPKGDLLLLYTDGAYSGLAADREHGAAEVLRLVNEFSGGEVNTLCHRIFDCGQPEFARSEDDSTVVVVRRQELVGDEKKDESEELAGAAA